VVALLMNEVWPSRHSFGKSVFEKIESMLPLMTTCSTVQEWDFAQHKSAAKLVLADDPEKCSKLDSIHNNPNYYDGYVLKEMEGSLGKRVDSHAEHNHSSVVAHLGNGGNLNLAEQVCQLLERHKNKVLQRQSFEDVQFITSGNYKSKHHSKRHQLDDTAAKQSLSSHSYKMYTDAFQHA
jgi:hypothetical protein